MGSPTKTRAVVFDFDGTLTDPRPTAALFAERFYGYLLDARPDARALVDRHLRDERGAPELWSNDVIVARGTADPWLGATSVARAALTELLGATDKSAVEALVSTAFHRAYDEVRAPFREGVCSLFGALIDRSISVNVVSNSPRDRVLARLVTAGLSDAQLARVTVVGGAQKFVVAAAESERARGRRTRSRDREASSTRTRSRRSSSSCAEERRARSAFATRPGPPSRYQTNGAHCVGHGVCESIPSTLRWTLA